MDWANQLHKEIREINGITAQAAMLENPEITKEAALSGHGGELIPDIVRVRHLSKEQFEKEHSWIVKRAQINMESELERMLDNYNLVMLLEALADVVEEMGESQQEEKWSMAAKEISAASREISRIDPEIFGR